MTSISHNWQGLNFTMQHQSEINWCWAATSASTALFYKPTSGWSQCKVAAQALSQDCCSSPTPCNQAWYLDKALTITGNFDHYDGQPESIETLYEQLVKGRSLGWRVAWRNGGAHFGMLTGCYWDSIIGPPSSSSSNLAVDVRDPWYGNSEQVPYNTFLNNYQGAGNWQQSYFTQP